MACCPDAIQSHKAADRALDNAALSSIIAQQLSEFGHKIKAQFGSSCHYSQRLIDALAANTAGQDLGVRHFEQWLQHQLIPPQFPQTNGGRLPSSIKGH